MFLLPTSMTSAVPALNPQSILGHRLLPPNVFKKLSLEMLLSLEKQKTGKMDRDDCSRDEDPVLISSLSWESQKKIQVLDQWGFKETLKNVVA